MTKHKWHKEIKAWLNGKKVQGCDYNDSNWWVVTSITAFGDESTSFRIKTK